MKVREYVGGEKTSRIRFDSVFGITFGSINPFCTLFWIGFFVTFHFLGEERRDAFRLLHQHSPFPRTPYVTQSLEKHKMLQMKEKASMDLPESPH